MARKSVPFSPVDAAWLHMETPTSSAVITSVFTFDQPIEWKRFRENIKCRMLAYDRFRMRVKEPLVRVGIPRWEMDPHFSLDSHVHRRALPAPGGQAELHELVGDIMSTALDFSKPLWQMYLIENYGPGCAVVSRLHHCVGDGMALMQVLLSTTDCEPDAPVTALVRSTEKKQARGLAGALQPTVKTVTRTLDTAEKLLYEGIDTIEDPGRVLDLAEVGLSGTRALAKLVLTPPDKKNLFRGKCSGRKRAAWTRPLDLNDVKLIGKAFDGPINDVLISCLSGALGRYLAGRDQATAGLNIRAMVPVNLRPPDQCDDLGNGFGLVLLSLPVGVSDPAKRLRIVKKRMDEIKNTPEAVVAFGVLNGMGLTPIQVEKLIMWFFTAKVSGVMTNVPGPRQQLYYAGRAIRSMIFWVPSPGNLGIGMSIFSYNGTVTVGIATDVAVVPDPESIVAAFTEEFNSMLGRVQPARAAVPELPAGAVAVLPRKTGRVRANGHDGPICTAVTKSGKPCHYHALPGRTTCARHTPVREKETAAA